MRGIRGGKKGKGIVKEHVYRIHGQSQGGGGRGTECGRWCMGRAGESDGGKLGTTVIEQHKNLKLNY